MKELDNIQMSVNGKRLRLVISGNPTELSLVEARSYEPAIRHNRRVQTGAVEGSESPPKQET